MIDLYLLKNIKYTRLDIVVLKGCISGIEKIQQLIVVFTLLIVVINNQQ